MCHYHVSIKVAVKSDTGKTRASAHYAYLGRTGKFEKLRSVEELVQIQSGNMPSWAEADPSIFWLGSDTYERANGSVYRELEASLPRELSLEQQMEIVDAFRRQVLIDHPFTLAVHIKNASDGEPQPHVHLMWSERKLDGLERDPQIFFKRATAPRKGKSGNVKNDPDPAKGGCTKISMQPRLMEFRELWATLTNDAYRKAGMSEQVSHLSLVAQEIKRAPERHLGPIRAQGKEGKILVERRKMRQDAELKEAEALATIERLIKARMRQAKILDLLMTAPTIAGPKDHLEQMSRSVDEFYPDLHNNPMTKNMFSVLQAHETMPFSKIRQKPQAHAYSPELFRAKTRRVAFLIEQYGYSSDNLATFWRIQINPRSREIVYEQKGGKNRVVDKGAMITADHGNGSEISAMIELAKLKNWPSIVFTGSESFKLSAMIAGLHAGLNVKAISLQDKLLLERAQRIATINFKISLESEQGLRWGSYQTRAC